ncbi:MAG: multicopper oxidase domain-containing protein [Sulfuriferula sp.]
MNALSLRKWLLPLAVAAVFTAPQQAMARVYVQCPGDTNGDAIPEVGAPGYDSNVKCMHLSAGDGYSVMPDGKQLYTFGFSDLTGVLPGTGSVDERLDKGILAAQQPAPTIELKEGQHVYLTLTNVGMILRPDLFDPHSVHFHGFPNAASIFDGLPEASITANMGSSLTYFYNIVEPGTFIYHCHVEAAEHMQMGMLGQLFVKPAQDVILTSPPPSNTIPTSANGVPLGGYVYNDGDGSTGYHKSYALQFNSFDHVFHEEHIGVQPLPFATLVSSYTFINGRGYPDTANPNPLPSAADNPRAGIIPGPGVVTTGQPLSALVTLNRPVEGSILLLRLSNLSVADFFSVTALGLPMRVVGQGARILHGGGEVTGKDLSYDTSVLTLGGGETSDVLIDTSGVPAGTYFLYTTNLNFLSNGAEDNGGMMTEIVIN